MYLINFKNKNEYRCNKRKKVTLAHKIMLFIATLIANTRVV